jgi:hypothetical protein
MVEKKMEPGLKDIVSLVSELLNSLELNETVSIDLKLIDYIVKQV